MPEAEAKLDFKILNRYRADGHQYIDIGYTPKQGNMNEGHLVIDGKTGDLIRYQFTYRPRENFFDIKIDNPQYTLDNSEKVWKYDWHYKIIDGHTVPEKLKLDLYFSVIKDKKEPHGLHTSSYFLLYNYSPVNATGAALSSKLENDRLKIKSTKYDKEFWKNNVMIKRTMEEENAIHAFETANSF